MADKKVQIKNTGGDSLFPRATLDNIGANTASNTTMIASGGKILNTYLPSATSVEAGTVQLATDAETSSGTVTGKAVTPAGMKNAMMWTAIQDCGETIPFCSFSVISLNTVTGLIAASKFKLSIGKILIGSLPIPFDSFRIVLPDLVADCIALCKLKLSFQVIGGCIDRQLLYGLIHGMSPVSHVISFRTEISTIPYHPFLSF